MVARLALVKWTARRPSMDIQSRAALLSFQSHTELQRERSRQRVSCTSPHLLCSRTQGGQGSRTAGSALRRLPLPHAGAPTWTDPTSYTHLLPSYKPLHALFQSRPLVMPKLLQDLGRLGIIDCGEVVTALEVVRELARGIELAEDVEYLVPVVRARDGPQARVDGRGEGESAEVYQSGVLDRDEVF